MYATRSNPRLRSDLVNMRQLAKPGAVLLIDDLDEGPGPALQRAEREHIVKVLERRMFNRSNVGRQPVPPSCAAAALELQGVLGLGGRALRRSR